MKRGIPLTPFWLVKSVDKHFTDTFTTTGPLYGAQLTLTPLQAMVLTLHTRFWLILLRTLKAWGFVVGCLADHISQHLQVEMLQWVAIRHYFLTGGNPMSLTNFSIVHTQWWKLVIWLVIFNHHILTRRNFAMLKFVNVSEGSSQQKWFNVIL